MTLCTSVGRRPSPAPPSSHHRNTERWGGWSWSAAMAWCIRRGTSERTAADAPGPARGRPPPPYTPRRRPPPRTPIWPYRLPPAPSPHAGPPHYVDVHAGKCSLSRPPVVVEDQKRVCMPEDGLGGSAPRSSPLLTSAGVLSGDRSEIRWSCNERGEVYWLDTRVYIEIDGSGRHGGMPAGTPKHGVWTPPSGLQQSAPRGRQIYFSVWIRNQRDVQCLGATQNRSALGPDSPSFVRVN
jgi:hypothetical protein